MAQEKDSEGNFTQLRTRAEETLSLKPSDMEEISQLSSEGIQRLVHELRVHQIELEMQNEDLRQAQIKLEELKDRYLDLYDFAPVGYVTLNEKGIILEANLTAVRLLGVERHSLMKMFFSGFVCQEFGDAYYLYLQQVFETQSKQTCEIKLAREDGSHFYAQLESIAVQDESGQFNRCRTMVSDITEQKREQQALRDREYLLETILATSPVGISFTIDRTINWVNEAWMKIFGFEDDHECVGECTRILYPSEEEYRRVGRILYANLEGQECREADVTFSRKDGSVFDAHIRVKLQEPLSLQKGAVAAITDTSERKRADLALKNSEMRYRRLFEAAKDGILIVDADTAQIVDVNPFLIELLGYPKGKLVEKGLCDTGLFEDTAKCKALFLELQSKEIARYEDLLLRKKDGSTIEVEFVSNAYQVEGLKVIQCSIRDITDRKRLQRQLLQSQKMEAVGILAGGVAHDFNNLLTVVQGFSELLLMEMDENAPGYSDLRKIHEAGLRGAELVRNLMAFSRKAETRPRPINVNHEVVRIETLLSRTIPKMIEIETHLAKDLAAVHADPDQIGQLLMNLAVNAEQAMPKGGNLTISTTNAFLDEQYCRFYREIQPGTYVLLTVSDTGQGMAKETLEHIFEPFFTTKGVGKGTGLGLAIVYGIVRQHGGHIFCSSEPSHGTTFKIYLPAMKGAEAEIEAEPEHVLSRGGTETILLVDDEDFIRDLGQTFLNRAGYRVLTAASGPEAVQWYLREGDRISLIILDLIMPEMGGEECLEEILAINPDAKILISSGAAVEGKKKEIVESGARGFISKPFQLNDMLKTVREILDED